MLIVFISSIPELQIGNILRNVDINFLIINLEKGICKYYAT